MTTTQQFQAIIDQADFAESNVSDLEVLITGVDQDRPFETQITQILTTFDDIRTWCNGKILEAEQAQVMAGFLDEIKVVFEKYSATISTMSFEDGYGQTYGEPGTGFLLTASLDGVISTKEIKKSVIAKEDLV